MPLTEANYENAVIEIFHDTFGYSHIYGPGVLRDYTDQFHTGKSLPTLLRLMPGEI